MKAHNQKRMQKHPFTREERFLAIDKPNLMPLPPTDFEIISYTDLKVSPNCCVYLGRDQHYYTVPYQHIGKKGDIVALEVNMRPPGGIAPTMMNYASGTDVYEVWADMIAFDKTDRGSSRYEICAFASRRDGLSFRLTPEEVREKYDLLEEGRVEEALSGAMANYMFVANFKTEDEARAFMVDVLS